MLYVDALETHIEKRHHRLTEQECDEQDGEGSADYREKCERRGYKESYTSAVDVYNCQHLLTSGFGTTYTKERTGIKLSKANMATKVCVSVRIVGLIACVLNKYSLM